MPALFHVKQARRAVYTVKSVAGGLVNRHSPRAVIGFGRIATVEGNRCRFEKGGIGHSAAFREAA